MGRDGAADAGGGVRLIPVDPADSAHLRVLYNLLAEREPSASISHKKMPPWDEHVAFVRSLPYEAWYFFQVAGVPQLMPEGATYLTRQGEIGIGVFRAVQRYGYGADAVQLLMQQHGPRRYLANIAPANDASRRMFEKLGFNTIQHTLALEPTKVT